MTILPRALATLLALALFAPALAAKFSVSPVRVYLSAEARTGLMRIQNHSDRTIRLQVETMVWAEALDGEMLLTPTKDLVAFPTFFSIPAGEHRTLRVGVPTAPKGTERSYRVFVTELPDPEAVPEGISQIRMLLRMGMPVFVTPKGAKARPRLEGLRLEDGEARFTLANSGDAHTRSTAVRIWAENVDGETVFEKKRDGWYLLADGRRDYTLAIPAALCPSLALLGAEVRTEAGVVDALVDVDPTTQCAP
jgi:fimbrial chaperone protein